MSTPSIEIPLFPLDVVLFPGTALPLYIFEPRYRQMIADCDQDDRPFGVVLAKPEAEIDHEEPYEVGTLAQIHNLQRLDDGCFNLMGVGVRRFRILDQRHDKPYLSALVELYDDELDVQEEAELQSMAQQARQLFTTYLKMLLVAPGGLEVQANLPLAPEELSHFIAYFLEIENAKKQSYLELTSAMQRLKDEIIVLRREVPFMRQMLYNHPDTELSRLN